MIYPHYSLLERMGVVTKDDVVVVLGCHRYESDIARQLLDVECKTLLSVDIFQPHIDYVRGLKFKATTHLAKCCDVREVPIREGSIVILTDVLEHIPREYGEKLLLKIEASAKKIVIFVPLEPDGFHRRVLDKENPADEHLSWWKEGDFKSRGYKTEIITNSNAEMDPVTGDIKHWDALWAIK